MKEYIERAVAEQAIAAIMPSMSTPDGAGANDEMVFAAQEICADALNTIRRIPAAEVAEVRHGRWIPKINHTYMPVEYDENGAPILHRYTSYYCSLCGREEAKEEPYCHCGARMDKEDEIYD